eukprot:gene3513-3848_t
MRREKAFFMLTLSSLPLVLLFLVLVLEVKIICSKEISSKDTEEEEHNRRETVANFPTFQNLQGFAQLNTSHAGRNDVYNSDRPDHPLPDSISTDSLYFYTCPFYSASQTSSATSDGTPKCMFYMNGGTQVTVTSCGESESGGYCSGDQYLRLTDAYGNQLASKGKEPERKYMHWPSLGSQFNLQQLDPLHANPPTPGTPVGQVVHTLPLQDYRQRPHHNRPSSVPL